MKYLFGVFLVAVSIGEFNGNYSWLFGALFIVGLYLMVDGIVGWKIDNIKNGRT